MPADTLSNNPPEPLVIYKEKAEKYVKDAKAFETITDDNAALATDHLNLGTGLAGEIDKQRLAEKRPHLDANTLIDKNYNPVHASVETARTGIRGRLEAYARAKKAEAERIAAEEARKLREAEEAKRAAEAESEDDPFLAATAEAIPDVAEQAARTKVAELQVAASTRVSSASGGRTFAVRAAPKTAKITDAHALCDYLIKANHSELAECLQKLANQNARAKGAIAWPGTEIVGGD